MPHSPYTICLVKPSRLLLITFFLIGVVIHSHSQTFHLDKTTYQKGEKISVHFDRADSLSGKAWIGIVPAHVTHGSEERNDRYDIVYRFIEDHPNGNMTFYAPSYGTSWDIRFNSNDRGNQEYSYETIYIDSTSEETSLTEELAIWNVPAIGIGYIEGGELSEIKVLGHTHKTQKAPFNTRFNVASLTKPVVAMLTLNLVSSGAWDLDEPLAKYWVDPDVKDDPRHELLTTRHVLSHQTGFPNWRRDKALSFSFDPGSGYGYSGEGYEYLREALEKRFSKPMEKLVDSLLFQPLGISESHFIWDQDLGYERFAQWHDEGRYTYSVWEREDANAADDLITTLEDYGRFVVSVLQKTGISEAVYEDMVRMQVERRENKGFGLGWELITGLPNGEIALTHGGSDRGVQTIVMLFPKSQRGLLVFTNGDNGSRLFLRVIQSYIPDLFEALLRYSR